MNEPSAKEDLFTAGTVLVFLLFSIIAGVSQCEAQVDVKSRSQTEQAK